MGIMCNPMGKTKSIMRKLDNEFLKRVQEEKEKKEKKKSKETQK